MERMHVNQDRDRHETHDVERHLARAWPPDQWRDVPVLLAVSGGADSVALLRACCAVAARCGAAGRLAVAHFHHRRRGSEADQDAAFVTALCRSLDVPCHIGYAAQDRIGGSGGRSRQGLARTARYAFLRQTAQDAGARFLATAHSADDQAETVLHRILRGTGTKGLTGIPRLRPLGPYMALVRPLLDLPHGALVEYLAAIGQPYREDSSNRDRRYTRARIRHELLPQLARQYNPQIVASLCRLAGLAGEVQQLVDEQSHRLAERCLRARSPDRLELDCRSFADQPSLLVRETLIVLWKHQGWPLVDMSHQRWGELAELAEPRPTVLSRTFPGPVQAVRTGERLILERGPDHG